MSKLILFLILITLSFKLSTLNCSAQAPHAFKYQAIIRNTGGSILANQNVGLRISIRQGSDVGTIVYSETHSTVTNQFGLVNLEIGNGTPATGSFASVTWASNSFFVELEIDPAGGTDYTSMGVSQLLSVPYALFAESAGNTGDNDTSATNELQSLSLNGSQLSITGGNTVTLPSNSYTEGTGIDINGSTITNTAPDQTVSVTQGTGISISGAYPSFSISSSQNLAQTLTNGNSAGNSGIDMNTKALSNASVLGLTYNDASYIDMYYGSIRDYWGNHGQNGQVLTAHSLGVDSGYVIWQNPVSLIPGTGIDITSNTITNTSPDQEITLTGTGGTSVTGAYPDFTIYSDSAACNWKLSGANIFNGNDGNVGIGLNNPVGKLVVKGDSLAPANEPLFEVKNKNGDPVFIVYPDSVHIYVKDAGSKAAAQGGFAVSGRSSSKGTSTDYLRVTPDSTRIYTGDPAAGFGVGDLSGGTAPTSYMNLTPGNYFIGHESGISNIGGQYNSFLGYQAGKSNTSGFDNVYIGYKSGLFSTSGYENVFLGMQAGYHNIDGYYNVFVGNMCGFSNTSGYENIFLGNSAGYSNTDGRYNVYIGISAGYYNESGFENTFSGFNSGQKTTGSKNTYYGSYTGSNSLNVSGNTFIGSNSGANDSAGSYNTFLGNYSGSGLKDGFYNTLLGSDAGSYLTNGVTNVMIGGRSGEYNETGSGNVFIGFEAGKNEMGSDKLYIENSGVNSSQALIYGEFDTNKLNFNAKVSVNDVLRLVPRSSPPSGPAEGDMYMNGTEHKLYVYNGTTWIALW